MTQETQTDTKGPKGNTNSLRSRKWCLTLNNWTEDEYKHINTQFKEKSLHYIIGKEVGESGTPHLQMFVEFKNATTFQSLKKLNERLHIEKAKGSIEENKKYCSKDKDFETNIFTLEEQILKEEYKDVVWKDWQAKIIKIICEKPNKRKIHWFWEEVGNIGKSYICKYISLKYNAIICSGKTGDIFYQVNTWRQQNTSEAQIPPCIIDAPRSEFAHINYAAIEALKNGFIYSGKYEGGKVHGLSPHVIVFANSPPKVDAMSQDRWDIVYLGKNIEHSQ